MPEVSGRNRYWALLAGSALALTFALAALPAAAQDQYEYDDRTAVEPGAPPEEGMGDEAVADESATDEEMAADEAAAGEQIAETSEVIVTAPRIRVEQGAMLQPPSKYRLSRAVAYDDLDLRTGEGAAELKARVRQTAGEICEELASLDRPSSYDDAVCYREAVANAIPRANTAIEHARSFASY
jgi:UrcA family protein